MKRSPLIAILSIVSGPSCTDGGTKDNDAPPSETADGRCDGPGGWSYVEAGQDLTCGIHPDGCPECWGLKGDIKLSSDTGVYGTFYDSGQDSPPAGPFRSISLVTSESSGGPGTHACGVLNDAGVSCWGRNDRAQAEAPPGTYLAAEVFDVGSCALETDGELVCWGEGSGGPPKGVYTELAIGSGIGAVLGQDGAATAWIATSATGGDFPERTEGPFNHIAIGGYACAIRVDGTLYCWSPGFPEYNAEIQATTPKGTYTAVCSSRLINCALATDGYPVCFGTDPDSPLLAPPKVRLTQITCGLAHACGITPDQEIVCWGDLSHGEGTPPS